MRELLDLDRFPLERPDSPRDLHLIERCKADLAAHGMFTLEFIYVRSLGTARHGGENRA